MDNNDTGVLVKAIWFDGGTPLGFLRFPRIPAADESGRDVIANWIRFCIGNNRLGSVAVAGKASVFTGSDRLCGFILLIDACFGGN